MEVSGQLHAPVALSPGKTHRYVLDRRLRGPQRWSGQGGEEKNLQHKISVISKLIKQKN